MAKTRLTNEKREAVLTYMMHHYRARLPDLTKKIEKMKKQLVKEANKMIREKYPESHMKVLRQYKLTTEDRCLRYNNNETGKYFVINFYSEDAIVDMPYARGCNAHDVFVATDSFDKLYEDWQALKRQNDEDCNKKRVEYRSFINACRNVEDVTEVVPLPPEIMEKLVTTNNAIVAVSQESIVALREEFQEAA